VGGVALSLDTGEIRLSGSRFSGRPGRGRLRGVHDRRREVVSPRCRSYAARAAVMVV
jgi:hypothetical protein